MTTIPVAHVHAAAYSIAPIFGDALILASESTKKGPKGVVAVGTPDVISEFLSELEREIVDHRHALKLGTPQESLDGIIDEMRRRTRIDNDGNATAFYWPPRGK